jgi:hypothetical protein
LKWQNTPIHAEDAGSHSLRSAAVVTREWMIETGISMDDAPTAAMELLSLCIFRNNYPLNRKLGRRRLASAERGGHDRPAHRPRPRKVETGSARLSVKRSLMRPATREAKTGRRNKMEIVKNIKINGRETQLWMTRDAEGRKTYCVSGRNADGSADEPTGNGMQTTQKAAIESAKEAEYEQVCDQLGFRAACRMVKIHANGSIGFWAGKPEEVRNLLNAVRNAGMRPHPGLVAAARR